MTSEVNRGRVIFNPPPKGWITLDEAAALLGRSRTCVYNWTRESNPRRPQLKGARRDEDHPRRRWILRRRDMEEFAERYGLVVIE